MKFFNEKPQKAPKEKVINIKALLKLARQYINENNSKKAQQCCKKVLRKNSKNYMAHVLLGKTYGITDDALLSFEKAIELKPDHPLAWQGLAQHYEAKDEKSTKIKLLNIYDKILSLDVEEDYANKTIIKVGELGCRLRNSDTISSLLRYVNTQNNKKLVETAKKQLLHLLKSNIPRKAEDLPGLIDHMKKLDIKDLSSDHYELVILGDLMLQYYDFIPAVDHILALEIYGKSEHMKMWLCRVICDVYQMHNSVYGFDFNKNLFILVTGVEHTKYGGMVISVSYYIRGMFELAYQKCISVVREHLDELDESQAQFLINCTKMTPNVMRTKNLCEFFLGKPNLTDTAFIISVNAILLSCYLEEKKFYKALYHLKKIPINKIDSFVLSELANQFFELDTIENVTWELLDSTEYFDLFKAFNCIKYRKFFEAIEKLKPFNKHPLKYYYLAIAYWFVDENEESFQNFKKAAEVLPNHPKIHYCLGIHNYRNKDDIEESRNCFEKSYALCKTDRNVIKMLSIIYVRLGQLDLEFDLLQSAFEIPETCDFWICMRLGRICYDRGIMDEALIYLQKALNMNPQDVTALELIGDINFNKKEYDQALMAYNKVLELSRNSVVIFKCLKRVGYIYSEKMLHHKAIFIFDSILDNDPTDVTALKGLTENRVIFALKHVSDDLHKDAREQMQSAINRISAAMSMGIKDLTYWLLYGDVLVFMTRLPKEYNFVNLQTPEGETKKEKIDMYKMAIESYCNVIKFRDSSALFKCAITYFEYYCETRNMAFCKTSYNLAVLYMKVNPNVWLIWDFLGKICYHLEKCEMAYYCFSKALNLCEDGEFKGWYELGLFYLKLDKHQLASYRYVIEKFDLSTFAPTNGEEELLDTNLNHNDNSETNDMDLLNITDIDKQEFTEWFRTFNPTTIPPNEPTFEAPIESLKIVPYAIEIIEWYLCFEDETAWSCYSLGNLQERKGLLEPALRHYDRAYAIAHDKVKNELLSHKGRVLMKMQEYEEAVDVYTRVQERNLQDTCALGLALFKINNYKRSYASYVKALSDLCKSDEERVDVLIAMSNVAYRLNGLCDGATILLQAVSIKCGEGQDFNLPFMKSYVFKRVDIQLVAHVMSVHLHKHIDKTIWWYYMGLNYLRGVRKYAKLTRACIKRAIRVNTVSERNGKLYALISIAEFYAGNRKKALFYTTQALKLYPIQPELWATLVLCIYADDLWPRKADFLRVIIQTLRRLVNVSEPLDKWLTKVEEDTNGKTKNFHFN